MWNGSLILGDFWSMYVGESDQNSPHAHVAVQLALGVDGDLTVHVGGRHLRARGVAIRPLAKHTVAAGRQVVFVYVEPQACIGRGLLRALGERAAMVLPERFIPTGAEVADPKALLDLLSAALGVHDRPPLDARLALALGTLEQFGGAPGAVRTAAQNSGLSPARLRALASEHLGAPLSRWVLWRKLERAGRALAGGASLAEAAAAGGFADQAHFSRTMRRMFGVTPSVAASALR